MLAPPLLSSFFIIFGGRAGLSSSAGRCQLDGIPMIATTTVVQRLITSMHGVSARNSPHDTVLTIATANGTTPVPHCSDG